jgi:hypothetical protein
MEQTVRIRIHVNGESYLYSFTTKRPETGGNAVLTDDTMVMIHGVRQDESDVKWHYFPVKNVVYYTTKPVGS